jgi:hypothetical protein
MGGRVVIRLAAAAALLSCYYDSNAVENSDGDGGHDDGAERAAVRKLRDNNI